MLHLLPEGVRTMIRPPIMPTPGDIESWRMQAETIRRFGGVRLGDFDWPWVVLSLIQALDEAAARWNRRAPGGGGRDE
jgi:hypothetical protein